MNSVYGYARVSSTDQNAERQHLSLQRQGIPRHRIFTDRMSGKDFRRPRYEDLLGTFIADLVLQVLSFVAQNERENIRRRQAEGIAAARLRGIRLGREPRPLPPNFSEMYELWKTGKISAVKAAEQCGMARSTFRYRAESIKKSED